MTEFVDRNPISTSRPLICPLCSSFSTPPFAAQTRRVIRCQLKVDRYKKPLLTGRLFDIIHVKWRLASTPDRISADVRRQIAESEVRYVSSMTFWEIVFKYQIGKLKLGLDPIVWLRRVEKKFALTVVGVSHEIMVNAALLPLHHRDPADRFIIAMALKMKLPVVTSDDNFPKYGVSTVI